MAVKKAKKGRVWTAEFVVCSRLKDPADAIKMLQEARAIYGDDLVIAEVRG